MLQTQVQPYLNFEGRCEEAVNFYRTALEAEVIMMMRLGECPEPPAEGLMPPGSENKIMHVAFRVGSTTVMASDCQCGGKSSFQGFSLSLALADEAAAQKVFQALAEGGTVEMPLGQTFWSPCFGMVRDRFGLGWMINVETTQPA